MKCHKKTLSPETIKLGAEATHRGNSERYQRKGKIFLVELVWWDTQNSWRLQHTDCEDRCDSLFALYKGLRISALLKLGVLIICKLGLPFKCAISQSTVGLLPKLSLFSSTPYWYLLVDCGVCTSGEKLLHTFYRAAKGEYHFLTLCEW